MKVSQSSVIISLTIVIHKLVNISLSVRVNIFFLLNLGRVFEQYNIVIMMRVLKGSKILKYNYFIFIFKFNI